KLLRKDGLHEVVQDFSTAAASKLFVQEICELVRFFIFCAAPSQDFAMESYR
nr:hypothetical protein [Tanacetum cinerariifolium]